MGHFVKNGSTTGSNSVDLDDLLHQLKDLDLPTGRGTDQHDRKLGAIGGDATRGNCAMLDSPIDSKRNRKMAPPRVDVSSRPTTAEVLDELEREGIETHSPEQSLLSSSSLDRLEDSVLQEYFSLTPVSSPTKHAVRVKGENSIDVLLAEIGSGDDDFSQEAKRGAGKPTAPADAPAKGKSCVVM